MKRFFAKLGRFFWSRGFLIFILAIVALVILFYVEEDWRGARAWAATKAEWEAKGESFDYAKFIPSPVPDDQNISALPLFDLTPIRETSGVYQDQAKLKKAIHSSEPNWTYIKSGDWPHGETSNLSEIKEGLARNYSLLFKKSKPPTNSLELFDAIYPFYADFLRECSQRSVYSIKVDYPVSPPWNRSFGPITNGVQIAKLATLHAVLALDQKRGDLAIQDIQTVFKFAHGAGSDPTLIGGLVSIALPSICNSALFDGLTHHALTDPQLVELIRIYGSHDFLTGYQFSLRSEEAESVAIAQYTKKMNSSKLRLLLIQNESPNTGYVGVIPWADGWWDQNIDSLTTFHFNELATVNPKERLVFPNISEKLMSDAQAAADRWDGNAPWNFWYTMAAAAEGNITIKYAIAQVLIDEGRVACALERYRFAHGNYPPHLDALAPTYIDQVPHDIMSGEQFRYSLKSDGRYLLYSVGWNQTDDGGLYGFKKDSVKSIDYKSGDWPWPTPQAAASGK